MTFESIAMKNFKHHLKKYLFYFLCSSFSIMIFFMYSTLFFNEDLNKIEGFKLVLSTGMFSISVFAVFFVSYAHSSFIKSRTKEFGVYITLGMSSVHIRKMIFFENILVIFLSMCIGLSSGLLFSRLFQMVALKLLNIENFLYSLNYKSFALSIGVFTGIFLFVIILSSLSVRNLDIAGLFRKARISENKNKFSLVLGLSGVISIFFSSFLLYYFYNHRADGYDFALLVPLFLSFIGIYLIISNLGNGILQFIKIKPVFYFRNLLTATEISHRFNQNKKILLVLSILSTMIILFVGMTFSMFSQSKNMSQVLQPNHLEFISLDTVNKVTQEELNKIIHTANTPIMNQKSLEFLSLSIINNTDSSDILKSKPFLSQTTYNKANHSNLIVNKGEAVNIIIPGSQVMSDYKPQMGKIKLQTAKGTYELYSGSFFHTKWISGLQLYPSLTGMVISDEDYKELRNNVKPEQIGHYNSFSFKDWERSKETVSQIKFLIESSNKRNNVSNSSLFGVASRIEYYEMFKHNYSLGIFILSIIGILFFISSVNVLYFKQFSEIASAREKFYKLYKIGITEREIVQVISKEMKLIFFIPILLAVIPGLSFIWYSNSMLGGEDIILNLMLSASVIVALYFLLQAVLYLIIKQAYCTQILKNL